MTYIEIDGKLILSGCFIINKNNELLLLYRKDHNHYETPGGKVEIKDCVDPTRPTTSDLSKAARRELVEELGEEIQFTPLEFFDSVEFKIPNGRNAIANKFITRITYGTPVINEPETFASFEYIQISQLDKYPVSPDLKLFIPKLKEFIEKGI